jgi:hypothetical protein
LLAKPVFQGIALLGLLGVLGAWIRLGAAVRVAIASAVAWLGEPALRLLPWLLSLLVFLVPWAALMLGLRRYVDMPSLGEELAALDPARRQALRDAASEVGTALSRARVERRPVNVVGLYVAVVVLAAPVMLLWCVWPALLPKLFEPEWAAVLVLGTAVGGSLWGLGRAPWWVGALAGAVAAPGALFSVCWWIADRSEILSIEVAAALCIGAAPGWLVFWLGTRFAERWRQA